MNSDLEANYLLKNNIDASSTSNWNDGLGFDPIGDDTNKFTGGLTGNYYEIDGLYIDRPAENKVGLFGYIDYGEISNLRVINVDVSGQNFVAGLVGFQQIVTTGDMIFKNIYVDGIVRGNSYVGMFAAISKIALKFDIVKSL